MTKHKGRDCKISIVEYYLNIDFSLYVACEIFEVNVRVQNNLYIDVLKDMGKIKEIIKIYRF